MFKSILVLIILSLCLGTAAWLFFIWAVKKGAFDDVERAKYRMLEDDDELHHDRSDEKNNTNNSAPKK
ncbi:MAG: cbb3-type cytochrome oxidase assembly protein CcoS [Desulfobulbales bacterium]|nr:cbb3-type cytochrome oxidase assembly protein CcoS [Desulfobulbales bacterium]